MKHFKFISAVTLAGAVLAGCASTPVGPSVAVMPAPGKPFEQFQNDDATCRLYAQNAVGGATANGAAATSEMESIGLGTALGAAAGALSGGHNGAGQGAAIGMMGGAAIGSGSAQYSGQSVQRRYDIAYEQCMYAKGNQLPSGAYYRPAVIVQPAYVAPQPTYAPPPAYAPPPSQPYAPPPPPPAR